jgi:hypothetical protein
MDLHYDSSYVVTEVFLNLKMPSVENVDLCKQFYMRQHVASIGILSELRSQRILSLHFRLLVPIYRMSTNVRQRFRN